MQVYNVPTGKIIVDKFSKGQLEFLSIGDYGQAANIKADFLGQNDPIKGVPNGQIMPLEEKWVITISTQYGCNMKCKFCDVPSVGPGKNATANDMLAQILAARNQYPDVIATKRLNIHFARMGEPTFNTDVLMTAVYLAEQGREYLTLPCGTLHPVLTTMMPKKNSILKWYVEQWADIKNNVYKGEAGFQVSINSTNDEQRNEMYQGSTCSLQEISDIVKNLPDPVGRKYCINMAMADGYEGNGEKLAALFDPKKWMVKITPIHVNTATQVNGIQSTDAYDLYDFYAPHEESFKKAGFDTLVFVPSYDEDFGMITCGNAILSGRRPTVPFTVENY